MTLLVEISSSPCFGFIALKPILPLFYRAADVNPLVRTPRLHLFVFSPSSPSHCGGWVGCISFLFFFFFFYFLVLPTPNPLPAGKRALSLRPPAFISLAVKARPCLDLVAKTSSMGILFKCISSKVTKQ